MKELFDGIAEVIVSVSQMKCCIQAYPSEQLMESTDRIDFLTNLKPNGKYAGIVGIYRHNTSADRIGIFDKQIIEAIAPTVKWIAHNGAGYDQIDVAECKSKGGYTFETR